jgi:hypothetical protein
MLSEVLPVIRWDTKQDQHLDRVETGYGESLAARLGATLARLDTSASALSAALMTELSESDTSTLRRVLLAPETSCRLLWSDLPGNNDSCLAGFLLDALDLEAASRTGGRPKRTSAGECVWSALGDTCFDAARGGWVSQPSRAGLTVDAASPAVGHFDGTLRVGAGMLAYAQPTERAAALGKAEEAMWSLEAVSPGVADFVRRFTLVANLVVDPQIDRFSSGSMNQYIGRSIFWNAHEPSVGVGTVAEGLVHEAVHSLLFMHDVCTPWLPRNVDTEERVVSPWSGAELQVEPFLQACFVWYALLHFWALASRSGVFPDERVELGLATAHRGFAGEDLTEKVPHGLTPAVADLIRQMQAQARSLGGSSAAGV